MTRRSSRLVAEPPHMQAPTARAGSARLRGKPSNFAETKSSNPTDLHTGIVTNWNLPSNTIKTCVSPERWPLDDPEPEQWPTDIICLLHEASEYSKDDNELFQQELSAEILLRQKKNRSAKGKTNWMTATDLKKVCKRLEGLVKGRKDNKETPTQQDSATKPVRQRRTNGGSQEVQTRKTRAANNHQASQEEQHTVQHARGKPKEPESKEQRPSRAAQKRTASDLPLRPARRTRTTTSPKAKPAFLPPVTPANPPEASDDEGDPDQENTPPEPVSGRHIYGDFLPPTTLEFNPEAADAALDLTLPHTRTRKRRREEEKRKAEEKPVEVQIDSDPRDIDATGFLSELDPKEARRRRRKPRLSRLQAEPVAEPAWSQDVPVLATPMLTPAREDVVDGTPEGAETSVAEVEGVNVNFVLSIESLKQLLPATPDNATDDERELLEARLVLLHRDMTAYRVQVREIEERRREERSGLC